MQIEVIDNADNIAPLQQDWNELHARAEACVFIHHSWVLHNYRHFPTLGCRLILVYGDKKKLIGVFPFSIQEFRMKGVRCRALTHGGSAASDYAVFLVDPECNRRLMIKRVIEHLLDIQGDDWSFYKIDNLSDGDDNANMMRSLLLRHLYAGACATDITPIVDYACEYAEAKKISNIKRRFRSIQGDCTITHIRGSEINARHMQTFSHIHKQSYPDSGFDGASAQAFYRALIADAAFSQHVVLSQIDHEGQMIAAHFGFKDGQRFYYYVPTYDATFSTNGPGQYLLWQLIECAREEGLREFDLLRGAEAYKFNWTNRVNTNYTVFGVATHASRIKRLLVNLWLMKRQIPYYNQFIDEPA
jgi:CelD/BcsL family acetyltransferase involved in cellulose biosynthesis